ncbi:MAG: hypothetical protein FJ034_05010 [Chloroflexi bacterium]|nr:hypothetical protein [Chloroflexota bacterium]
MVAAVLLAVLGFVMAGQASFAREYVREELAAQKITFAAESALTEREETWKAGWAALVQFAAQPITTGEQAEAYAKYYIAVHMDTSAIDAGFPGATYATLGATRTGLTAQITAAKARGDTARAAGLEKKLASATSLRASMQTGETLRGLLLTVYGFSVLGEKADLAGNVLYGLAALMTVLSLAGFAHALPTPKDRVVLALDRGWAGAPSRT